MPASAKKHFQSTTVRMPRHIFEQAKTVVDRAKISSFNEFVIQAVEEKVRRLTEAEIDSAFAQMSSDPEYQRDSNALAGEFARSDWEALESTTIHERPKKRTTKARPR